VNSKGQFSIIAALLVAVVLIGTVITTYATLRYSASQDQPQILSAIDETNLALEKVLGFTVGYYGSVLKVTGDTSYAKDLTTNYLNSSLNNIADIKPEWGASFSLVSLDLSTNWFTNNSYSAGQAVVAYDLAGLGIYGMSYNASCRLDVQISNSSSTSQVCLSVTKDGDEPLVNLGEQNFQFYRYQYSNLTWNFAAPSGELTAFSNGTYLIDIPSGIDSSSYVVQVTDTRGIMVAAASFSRITSTLMWNTTTSIQGADYVDSNTTNVGTQSNFTAQQYGPDNINDTLTEGTFGTTLLPYYPSSFNLIGSTSNVSGALADLQSDNGVYMGFRSYASAYSGSSTFGYTTKGFSTNGLSYIRGSRFTCTSGGTATSISAYLQYTSTSSSFGNTNGGSSGYSIENTIRGQQFTSPSSAVVAQSITAYIYCSTASKLMKAAIYDSSGNKVAETEEVLVLTNYNPQWRTFTFDSPPTLVALTQYILVVWSQSGSGSADLRYSMGVSSGRYAAQIYGSWPSSVSFSTNSNPYSIYCNYIPIVKAKAAIYSGDGNTLIASTEELTLTTVDDWVTFNFASPPSLSASTQYVLAVWASDSNVAVYYDPGAARYFRQAATYPMWPSSVTDQGSSRTYSIYCTYDFASEYTCEVEFTGISDVQDWLDLVWAIDSSATVDGVNVNFTLWNYQAGRYALSGEDGYDSTTIGTSDVMIMQTITANPTAFRNSTGGWKLKFKAVSSSQFDLNVDLARYSPSIPNYALDIEEQWTNVNYVYPRQDLCIKTGNLSLEESLIVDVRVGSSWITLINSLQPNMWNDVSVTPYISSQNFTIRFRDGNSSSDPTRDSWDIDAVLLSPQPDIDVLLASQDSTMTIEVLQNGTMRWLGQNLQLTTQEKPIPPIPVKAIHVNQTINGINQEVPFQIEDWASEYRIPLGLTNNATVFSNRQMIVFLINVAVSKVTVWWNGSDMATQTPKAYTPTYFAGDDPNNNRLTNGKLTLEFGSSFTVKSTIGNTSSTANFMRINNEASTYGSGLAYVIHHGVVRDIAQQEAEWGTGGSGIGGADGCPNVYANIVLTLPAQATYYTYQLRLMFIDSATQSRTITDLCPINVTTAPAISQLQTENGTVNGIPIVTNGTGSFYNFTSGTWTAHHWSQFISGTQGAGIMFTNATNQQLYVFDSIAGNSVGALKVDNSTRTIELLPVARFSANFYSALDVTWHGAVATFDSSATPIYTMQGTAPTGLWLLVEYQPTITVTSEN
jgi:hypothetical protein